MNKIAVAKELVAVARELIADVVFDMETVDGWGEKIHQGLKKVAPVVGITKSTLGGDQHVSLLLLVSLDEKSNWQNGILENSTYFRMHLGNDGRLEYFSGHTGGLNFRKTRVKSADEVVSKVSRFVDEIRRSQGH